MLRRRLNVGEHTSHQFGTELGAGALAALVRAGSIGSLFSPGGAAMRCSSVLCSLALTFGIVAPGALTAQGGSVAGTVVNRATGAPVSDVQVSVAGTALRTFTDLRGRFHFDDLTGTIVVLEVRRIGFRAVRDTANVGDTNVRVALEQKMLELSQVIVTGTPTAVEIGKLGNAVSRIDAASITQTP